MIGNNTTGNPASTSSVSLMLVNISRISAPTPRTILRKASERLEPMAVSSIVVSLVSREITSPVRVISKKPGESVKR